MGLFSFSKKSESPEEIKGKIGYYGLKDFWLSLTKEEQVSITGYHQSFVGNSKDASPIKGDIEWSSSTRLQYITSLIGHATARKDYVLADKLINEGEKEIGVTANLVDAHFFLQEAAECYYKQKAVRDNALGLVAKYCRLDIALFQEYRKPLIKEFGIVPRILTFQRLAMIYEQEQRYDDAIEICNKAIEYELNDSTKGGFEGRVARIEKKKNK